MTTDEGGMAAMTDGEEGTDTVATAGAGTTASDTTETQTMTGREKEYRDSRGDRR